MYSISDTTFSSRYVLKTFLNQHIRYTKLSHGLYAPFFPYPNPQFSSLTFLQTFRQYSTKQKKIKNKLLTNDSAKGFPQFVLHPFLPLQISTSKV